MARATEIAFSVTDRSYETKNFLSLLNKVAYCAVECAEKLSNLDNTLAERNHYPSRIMEPVLTRSHFTTSRAKTLQRRAFEARRWGLAKRHVTLPDRLKVRQPLQGRNFQGWVVINHHRR